MVTIGFKKMNLLHDLASVTDVKHASPRDDIIVRRHDVHGEQSESYCTQMKYAEAVEL